MYFCAAARCAIESHNVYPNFVKLFWGKASLSFGEFIPIEEVIYTAYVSAQHGDAFPGLLLSIATAAMTKHLTLFPPK